MQTQPELSPSAYTPLPVRNAPERSARPAAVGAGICSLGVLLALPLIHRSRPAPLPITPAASADVSGTAVLPAGEASASLAPAELSAPLSAADLSVPREGAAAISAAPAAAVCAAAQSWSWPKSLSTMHRVSSGWQGFLGKHNDMTAGVTVVRQRLVSWNPANAPGRRELFALEMQDGTEQQVYDGQLAGRKAELQLARQNAAHAQRLLEESEQAQREQAQAAQAVSVSGPAAVAAAPVQRPAATARTGRAPAPAARRFRAANGAARAGGIVYASGTPLAPAQTSLASSFVAPILGALGIVSGAAVGGAGAGTSASLIAPAINDWQTEELATCRRQQNGQDLWQGGSGSFRYRVVTCDPSKPYGQRRTYEDTIIKDDGTEVKSYTLASPLVLDLAGKGVQTGTRNVLFDIDGRGRPESIQSIKDLAPGAGVLVFDADHDGKSGASGLELFGDRTDLDGDGKPDGFADGFAALRGLIEKAVSADVLPREVLARGALNSADLAALEKAYGLRLRVGGFNRAPVTLAAAGVVSLTFSSAAREKIADFDGAGNSVSLQPGAAFTRADGSAGTYADVWLAPNASKLEDAAWTNSVTSR